MRDRRRQGRIAPIGKIFSLTTHYISEEAMTNYNKIIYK
jgi:hypothetical protein